MFVCAVLLSCGGCNLLEYAASGLGIETGDDELLFMSFNVENLFDAVDDGNEYSEYDPGKGNWGIDDYYCKLQNIARVIRSADGGRGPDVIAFQELEKRQVLELLNGEFLPDLGYRFCFTAERRGETVQTGVLSRVPVSGLQCHAPSENGRYIIELELSPRGKGGDARPFVLFVNHWKSKLGGVEETEYLRYAAAEFLSHRISEISIPVIVCGDLNWDTNLTAEFSDIYAPLKQCGAPALGLPGTSSPLWITREPVEAASVGPETVLYDPWDLSSVPGSYVWDGAWSAIDHFFVSKDFVRSGGWTVTGFSVHTAEGQCDDNGYPLRFSTRSHTGCSDHLPVLLYLEFL